MERRVLWFLAILCLLSALGGCTRDPNVKKQKYVASGNRYLDSGKLREANIEFSNALKIDPNFAAAHFGMARVYLKLRLFPNAYAELNKTVELDPNNLEAQIEIGDFLLASSKAYPQNRDKALEKANFVLGKDPNYAKAYSLLSNIAFANGKPEEGFAQLQKAIALAPKDIDLRLSLGIMQGSQKDFTGAEATFKSVLQIDPKSASAYDMLAKLYATQQKWAEVEQTLKAGINALPQNLQLRLALAAFYLSPGQGKPDLSQQTIADAKKAMAKDTNALRTIAEFEYSIGKTDEALRDFAALVADHPKDSGSRSRYAELLAENGRDDEAGKQVSELLKQNPKDTTGRTIKAKLLLKQGKAADAVTLLQALVKDDPKNALAHHYLGVAYQAAGDRGQAEAEWREAVRLNPTLLPPYRALAAVAESRNDLDLLETAVNGMLKAEPNSAEAYIQKANLDSRRKDTAAAEQDLQKAVQVAPNNPDAYAALATLRFQQKKAPEALALFEKALTLSPGAVGPMRGILAIYLSQKQTDKAIARLKDQISRSPGTTAFSVMLAGLQADNKKPDEAVATLNSVIAKDPNNNEAYVLLARIDAANGKLDQAISAYQVLLQKNPNDVRVYLAVGSLEEQRNNPGAAKQMYQKALQLDPESPIANNDLAYIMIAQNDNLDMAISMAQSARRRLPDNPEIADTLGYGYLKKGVYSSAVELLEEAVKKSPNSAPAHYHLGLAYEKTNDKVKARDEFLKASKLNPQSEEGRAAQKEAQGLGGRG